MTPAAPAHLAAARLVLGLAVLCVSFGAIFARTADSPALATAAWRMTFASLVIALPLARSWRGLLAVSRRDLILGATAGLCLALHFAAWISSLERTTVASSTVLVNTMPLWVALLSRCINNEPASRRAWAGIGLSFAGATVIAGTDFSLSGTAWQGDLLALAGGFCCALYLLLGRQLRDRLALTHYCALTYFASVLVLWLIVGASGTRATGFSTSTWGALIGMALVAQIGGHTLYNWSLKHLTTGAVAVALMGEPIGSSLLAWRFFSETPSPMCLAGSLLVLAGIYLTGTAPARPVEHGPTGTTPAVTSP